MDPLSEALQLLGRQAELEIGLRKPGGIRITEERELYAVRERLNKYPYPNAIEAIVQAARNLGRSIDSISVTDIEQWSGAIRGGTH